MSRAAAPGAMARVAGSGSGLQMRPSKLGSATMRQYRPTSVCTSKTGMISSRCRLSCTDTSGSTRTRSSSEVEKSITPREPNPGSTIGATAATITAAAATRRAPRPAATSSRARAPGPVHTGPQPCTRRSPSANSERRGRR